MRKGSDTKSLKYGELRKAVKTTAKIVSYYHSSRMVVLEAALVAPVAHLAEAKMVRQPFPQEVNVADLTRLGPHRTKTPLVVVVALGVHAEAGDGSDSPSWASHRT